MSNAPSLSEQLTESLVIQDSTDSSGDINTVSAPRPPPHTPALDQLRTLLRQTLRISIADGRIFLGTFAGTDRLLNVLLINTDEFKLDSPSANPNGRFVGLVLVPWKFVVKIELHGQRAQTDSEVNPDPGVGLRGIVDTSGYGEDNELFMYG